MQGLPLQQCALRAGGCSGWCGWLWRKGVLLSNAVNHVAAAALIACSRTAARSSRRLHKHHRNSPNLAAPDLQVLRRHQTRSGRLGASVRRCGARLPTGRAQAADDAASPAEAAGGRGCKAGMRSVLLLLPSLSSGVVAGTRGTSAAAGSTACEHATLPPHRPHLAAPLHSPRCRLSCWDQCTPC